MARRRSSSTRRGQGPLHLHAPHRTLWILSLLLFLVGLAGTVLDMGVQIDRSLATWALILANAILLVATAVNTT